jgi:hypothetical protein
MVFPSGGILEIRFHRSSKLRTAAQDAATASRFMMNPNHRKHQTMQGQRGVDLGRLSDAATKHLKTALRWLGSDPIIG